MWASKTRCSVISFPHFSQLKHSFKETFSFWNPSFFSVPTFLLVFSLNSSWCSSMWTFKTFGPLNDFPHLSHFAFRGCLFSLGLISFLLMTSFSLSFLFFSFSCCSPFFNFSLKDLMSLSFFSFISFSSFTWISSSFSLSFVSFSYFANSSFWLRTVFLAFLIQA